jgi:psiF repeat
MKISSLFAAASVAMLLAGPAAYAHSKAAPHTTTVAANTKTAKTTTAKKTAKPRSAASMECSKEADAKGLHGKARKKFRSGCMKKAKAK